MVTAWDTGFAALVERQSSFVFRVAYSVLRNHHDSDDVVQDTFLKLYRSRKWEDLDNERAFLARAAWRIAVDRSSRADRLPKARIDMPDSILPSNCVNPEQAVISADWNATVRRLIDALPEQLRQPLALSTVEELKSHEIAAILGIPEGTVRSRLSRAREILKRKLGVLMAGAALLFLAISLETHHTYAPRTPQVARASTQPAETRTVPARDTSVTPPPKHRVKGERTVRKKSSPKDSRFPMLTPLTGSERALLALVEHYPAEARNVVAAMQQQNNHPIEIQAIEIQPLHSDGER